jgi:hypothetical protein
MDVGASAIACFNVQIRGRSLEAGHLRRHGVVTCGKQGVLELSAIVGGVDALVVGIEVY